MGTQYYLSPDTGDSQSHALTPAHYRYSLIDPGRVKGWVELSTVSEQLANCYATIELLRVGESIQRRGHECRYQDARMIYMWSHSIISNSRMFVIAQDVAESVGHRQLPLRWCVSRHQKFDSTFAPFPPMTTSCFLQRGVEVCETENRSSIIHSHSEYRKPRTHCVISRRSIFINSVKHF